MAPYISATIVEKKTEAVAVKIATWEAEEGVINGLFLQLSGREISQAEKSSLTSASLYSWFETSKRMGTFVQQPYLFTPSRIMEEQSREH